MKKSVKNVIIAAFCLFCLINSMVSSNINSNSGNTGASTYDYINRNEYN